MKNIFFTFLLLLVLQNAVAQTTGITTFILVRHAEKTDDGTSDPGLTPAGVERAQRLAALLSDAEIDAVFSTQYKRTMRTVSPAASARALEVQFYQPGNPVFVDEVLAKYPGKTVLIGGHSNTIPQLVNALIGRDEYETFPDDAYGNILIVSVVQKGEVTKVLGLHY